MPNIIFSNDWMSAEVDKNNLVIKSLKSKAEISLWANSSGEIFLTPNEDTNSRMIIDSDMRGNPLVVVEEKK